MTVSIEEIKPQSAKAQTSTHQGQDFDALFHTHWARVYGVIYRLVGDPDEADDLALEVFWQLHRRLNQTPRLPLPGNLAGWLYRVASNLGLNSLRADQRRQAYERRAGQQQLERSQAANPAQLVEQAEQRAQVRQVLAGMKPRNARLLILRHSGLSYAEIAAALRVSPNSIGTLIRRAEREFAQRYRALEGGHDD